VDEESFKFWVFSDYFINEYESKQSQILEKNYYVSQIKIIDVVIVK
jgi:hypothetical protein